MCEIPSVGKVKFTGTGDCAAANASGGIDTPVNRKGSCFFCTLGKDAWIDASKCATARKRTFVYQVRPAHTFTPRGTPRIHSMTSPRVSPLLQCLANHIDPFEFLPGCAERPRLKCPHCRVTVDNTLMEKEAKEREDLTPNQLEEKDREHRNSHAQGMLGRRPTVPADNRCRSRGVLHRRMNVTSNCLAATVLKVPFCEKKRIAINQLLDRMKFIWRVPEKAKNRAKTISAGNDARRMLSIAEALCGATKADGTVVKGMLEISYPEEWEAAKHGTAVEGLRAAAEGAEELRTEEGEVRAAKPAAAKKTPARANPIAPKPAGVSKPAKGQGKGKKPKAVAPVLTRGGKKVTATDTRNYAAQRKKADASASASPAPATPAPGAPSPAAAAFEDAVAEAAAATEHDGEVADDSLAPDADDPGDEMDVLEEDEEVGGLATAINVWRTAIQYMKDLHTPLEDHFNLQAREAHAVKVGASGKAWAIAINEHTANRSLWQYVHDAFAHVADDIREHGAGDRNDDAILEKGNRRFKRLGDRCVFRGGRNAHTWTRTIRVADKDAAGKKTGTFTKKTITVKAPQGQAAQAQRLECIAQICESGRKATSELLSAKELETKLEAKVLREVGRNNVEDALKAVHAKCKGK